jgi:hypothetical protein
MYLYVMNNNILKVLMTYDRILENKKIIFNEADISGIDELVYNPATKQGGTIGYGYDNGRKVQGITWKNHDNHLHIGFTNREVAMQVIDKAHSMGLRTTENPYAKTDPNGKVDNVHSSTSFHYKVFPGEPKVGAGVDISGNPQRITELIKWIESKYSSGTYSTDKTIDYTQSKTGKDGTTGAVNEPDANSEPEEDTFLKNILMSAGKALGLREGYLNEASSTSKHLFNNAGFKWGGGPSDHGSRALGNWQSDNAWDIMAPAGTPVYAIEGGVISKLGGSTELIRKVIYGYNVTIKSENNEFFYTHLGSRNSNLNIGDKVNKGDFLGTIGLPAENPKWPQHVHIGIKHGDIKTYIDSGGNILSSGTYSKNKTMDYTQSKTGKDGTTGAVNEPDANSEPEEDTFLKSILTGIGKSLGLKESFGRNIKEKYGTITIPSQYNDKIKSPVNGFVDNSKYVRGCKNQILVKIDDNEGYLQFCNVTNPTVSNGDPVYIGTLLGTTKDDVEVVWFDKQNYRKKLRNTSFDNVRKQPKQTKEKDIDDLKLPKKKNIPYTPKKEIERRYSDPALAVIPSLISNMFSDKTDNEGNVEKRWGYATDKKPVDPWIVNAISKPFKKIGQALGTNKNVKESKKLQEEIERIKKLLK